MDSKAVSDGLFRLLGESVGDCPPVLNRNGKEDFPGLVPVKKQLRGLGFFPGGDGLWKAPGKAEPTDRDSKPIMIVGSTFGSQKELESIPFEEDRDNKSKTWEPLIRLLHNADVKPDRSFYTNAFPGVLKGNGNVVKLHPAKLNARYMVEARKFFMAQLQHMQPRLVLFLGLLGPYALGEDLLNRCGWAPLLHPLEGKIQGFESVDLAGKSMCPDLIIPGIPHRVTVALLLHPCHRTPNLHLRKLGLDIGSGDPEPQFLKQVIRASTLGS